jgi:predicted Kef-type K+ transport protein
MDIVWVGVAFVFGILVSKINIPPLVGYLVAGLTLGAIGYEEDNILNEIAHLGVIFLLFTVGLHIKIKNILALEVLGTGLIHLFISTLIFVPIILFVGLGIEAAIIISIILGFSSTVLAAKNLESRGEMGAYYGRVAIGILIIQDLVAIGIIAYAGGGMPSYWSVVLFGLPLLRPLLSGLLRLLDRDELMLLMALALAIGGEALFMQFNLSGELGALAMGMLLANDEKGEQLEKKIWGIKEAFLVGFFLQIGLTGFPDASAWALIGLLTLILPFKAILFFALLMAFKLRARTAFQSTISLTAYSEFTLIAGAVASSMGLIPSDWILILAILTAVSYILNSILVNNEDRIWENLKDFLVKFQREGRTHDRQLSTLGAAEYLVIGMGLSGTAAYDFLKENDFQVVAMDINPDRISEHIEVGRRIVYGDAQDMGLWEKLDTSKLKSILIAMSTGIDQKIHVVNMLKGCEFKKRVFVLAMNDREEEAIKQAGGIPVVIPAKEIGRHMGVLSTEV